MLEAGRPRTYARGGAAPRLEHRLERRLEHTGAQTGAQTRAKCRSERARGAGRGRVCAELGEAVYARSWAVCAPGVVVYARRGWKAYFSMIFVDFLCFVVFLMYSQNLACNTGFLPTN